MGGTLSWSIDDAFKAMVDKAVKTKQPIYFVKDQGIYLMTDAKPNNLVVYAKGFDPNKAKFDDWYDRAHRVCGGDDFGEKLGTEFLAKVCAAGAKVLKIKLTSTRMTMEATR